MHKIFLFLLVIFQRIPVEAQPLWHLIKDKNNIRVYTADADSSEYKHIKVVGVLDGTLDKLKAIFLNVDKQKDWVYGTKDSHLVKKISNNELLYYIETALPWPVANRDIVIRMKIDENKINNNFTITTQGEPKAIPENKGKVRVNKFIGNWSVKAIGENKLSITYFLFVNPGGNLPSWVVNLFIGKGPYETFKKLGELLKE